MYPGNSAGKLGRFCSFDNKHEYNIVVVLKHKWYSINFYELKLYYFLYYYYLLLVAGGLYGLHLPWR